MSAKAAVAAMLGLPAYTPLDDVVAEGMNHIPVFLCDQPWAVVACRHAREHDVATQLVDAGWLFYLPREVRWCGGGRRRRRVEQPLFPRYVFATCLPEGDIAATAEMRHVVAVRRRENGGSVISPVVMRALMAKHAAGAYDSTIAKAKRPGLAGGYEAGDLVRIVDGALSGWNARILAVLSKREVTVEYSLFGRLCEAAIDATKIERVS